EMIGMTKKAGNVVINRGDKEMYDFLAAYIKRTGREADLNVVTYAITELTNIIETPEGISFVYSDINFFLPIIGRYNVENVLAAINIAQLLGIDLTKVSE